MTTPADRLPSRRLRDEREAANPRVALAADLLSRMDRGPQLSASARQRVAARLDALEQRPRPSVLGALRWAAVAMAVAIGGVSLAMPELSLRLRQRIAAALPTPSSPAVKGASHPPEGEASPARPEALPVPPLDPVPPAPPVAPAPLVLAPTVAPPRVDPLLSDARRLEAALGQRRAGDVAGARESLSRFRAERPRSPLAGEAALAELEADLALQSHADALALLDSLSGNGMGLDALPRAAELHVIRGELLGRAGRCAEALRELDGLRPTALSPALRERAAAGSAACREAVERAR